MTRFWTLFIPLLALALQCVMEMMYTSIELAHLMTENGPVETAQWIIMAFALGFGVLTLLRINPRTQAPLFAWVLIAVLASIYILGEEVSWGQHFLNWDTPEYWKAVNDQHETNFHNTSSWLDQKPRLILFAGIVIGGIIFPLLQKYKPGTLPEKFSIIYPSMALMPTALLVAGPYLAQEIAEHFFDGGIFERVSEIQELYMYYFILLYLIMLRKRLPVRTG